MPTVYILVLPRRVYNSWHAGIAKAEVSPSLFTPLSPSLLTPHQILYSAPLMDVFGREGLPEFLVTDIGVQLTSHTMGEFLKENGISHLIASLYHPQTNGLVERMNRTAKQVRGQIFRCSYTE